MMSVASKERRAGTASRAEGGVARGLGNIVLAAMVPVVW